MGRFGHHLLGTHSPKLCFFAAVAVVRVGCVPSRYLCVYASLPDRCAPLPSHCSAAGAQSRRLPVVGGGRAAGPVRNRGPAGLPPRAQEPLHPLQCHQTRRRLTGGVCQCLTPRNVVVIIDNTLAIYFSIQESQSRTMSAEQCHSLYLLPECVPCQDSTLILHKTIP